MSINSENSYISLNTSTLQVQYTAEKPKQSASKTLSQIKDVVEKSSIPDQLADELLAAATCIYKGYCNKHAQAKSFITRGGLSKVVSLYERIQLRVRGSALPFPPEILSNIFQFLSIKDIVFWSCTTRSASGALAAVWEDWAKLLRNQYTTEKEPVKQIQTQFESIRVLYQRKLLPNSCVVTKTKYIVKPILEVEKTLLNMVYYKNYNLEKYVTAIFSRSDIFSSWPHLVNCGVSPHFVCSNSGDTLLHRMLVYPCDPDLITSLIVRCNLDPHCKNIKGATPLHVAIEHANETDTSFIWRKRIQVIRWLLKKQGLVNAQDTKGNTALHYAAKRVFVSGLDEDGTHPFFQKADVNCWVLELVKVLLEQGADPSICNVKERLPLDYTYMSTGIFTFYSKPVHQLRVLLAVSSTFTHTFSEEEEEQSSSEDSGGDDFKDRDLFTIVDATRALRL